MRGGSVVAQAARGVFGRYHMLMQEKPLFTKMSTGFCVFSVGDIGSQMLIERKEELDIGRTLRTAAFGAVFFGLDPSLVGRFGNSRGTFRARGQVGQWKIAKHVLQTVPGPSLWCPGFQRWLRVHHVPRGGHGAHTCGRQMPRDRT